MKILVIDNETNIRESVVQLIKNFCPFPTILFEANGVASGLKSIEEVNPDILFLDVELDDGTGMDLLSSLTEINFHLVFITAHNKYAIDAFRFSAIDFLLKPISVDELIETFEKISKQVKNEVLHEQLQIMQDSLDKITYKDKKIVLKDSNSFYFIDVKDIIRCESDGQYTEFFIENNKKIIISKSLKEYEEMLEPYGFIRPHHSHIINSNKILRFDKSEGGILVMQNNDEIPVSHRKKSQILQILDSF
ncbi:LytTR family DNA-binding domain-containing protein [Flavobacterium paronense]|uniref:LytR/AlgR family response regulator transcription factor n=1 Tax=Flavobacterium paronense TaxID=1392775 RepID=A0ABV5GHH6_9FLAO|nr:LytTR family DNA-binding domain-containing protein [Flavobacterium paronense]MDN3676437.1 LytTR family DNA-binding domain-containing protein [Flavobacterium paronense]